MAKNILPLDALTRFKVANEATSFFYPLPSEIKTAKAGQEYFRKHGVRYKTAFELVEHLGEKEILEAPFRYCIAIDALLNNMARAGVLNEMGYDPQRQTMPKMYDCMNQQSSLQRPGKLWLSSALGGDFLHHIVSPAIVHLTGIDKETNDVAAGTGLIFHPNYILTCRHVINDMKIDKHQTTNQGQAFDIADQITHQEADVGLIRVDSKLAVVKGLAFLDPSISQRVYSLGYPRIPMASEASLVMQSGEVTNESITTTQKEKAFLYSAIVRPGNSGGPLLSIDGYVVGISMQDLIEKNNKENVPFSPHFAGIPASEIARCVAELDAKAVIPMENFE